MKKVLHLFCIFLKIGFFAFGGGLALFPTLKREFSDKRNWIADDALIDLFALAQTLPGLVAVNVSAFIGYRLHRFWGALVAAVGIIMPPIILITLIAAFLQSFADFPLVAKAFHGLNIAVVVLIGQALYAMAKRGLIDKTTVMVFFVALLLYLVASLNPIFLIIGGILFGLWFQRGKAL